jgi:hypothetical protein
LLEAAIEKVSATIYATFCRSKGTPSRIATMPKATTATFDTRT